MAAARGRPSAAPHVGPYLSLPERAQERAHDRARRAVRVDQSAGLPERLDALWDAWVSAFPSVEASLRVAKVFEVDRHRDVV